MDSQESKDDKDPMENIDQGELQQRDSHNGRRVKVSDINTLVDS